MRRKAKKSICVFQFSALGKLGMAGWHYFIFSKILFGISGNCVKFMPFASIFAFFLIKCLGSGQKILGRVGKHETTYIFI